MQSKVLCNCMRRENPTCLCRVTNLNRRGMETRSRLRCILQSGYWLLLMWRPCWVQTDHHCLCHVLLIHKYMPIYVHTCKCKIYPVTDRFPFCPVPYLCYLISLCYVQSQIKNKNSQHATINNPMVLVIHSREYSTKELRWQIGRSLKCTG